MRRAQPLTLNAAQRRQWGRYARAAQSPFVSTCEPGLCCSPLTVSKITRPPNNSASWLNMIERFFRDFTVKRGRAALHKVRPA